MKRKQITERENYLRAIERRGPQWIPINFILLPALWMRYRGELEDLVFRHPLVFESHGYERGKINFDEAPVLHREGERYTDAWGCVWRNAHGGILGQVVEHPLADWRELEHFRPPDPLKIINWEELKKTAEEQRRKGYIVKGGLKSFTEGGFFDRLQFLRGLENLLIDFMTNPPELQRLIDIVLDYNMTCIRKWLEIGVDVMLFHGDIAGQRDLLFSPDVFRKYLKPGYKEMFSTCRKAGVHVRYSSDGRVLKLIDDLVECGVSSHDPQLSVNPLEDILKIYNGKLSVMAYLDGQLLASLSPQAVRRQIREIVRQLGSPEGGLMIQAGPTEDASLECIEAVCTGWEEYGFHNWA